MELFACNNLTVDLRSGDSTKRVVDDVSFVLEAGKIYDLDGASGGGKSTVLLACAKLLPIVSGTFSLQGEDSSTFAPERWRKQVCLVPQRVEMVEGTVRDNLLLAWRLAVRRDETPPADDALREALENALLADVELDRDATQLSGGQAARVALLRAFLTHPQVLLLDEVDAALDAETSQAISSLTKLQAERGTAVLRIRHREPDGLACRTFHMAEGRIEG